ncbi:MAG: arsenite methyltransferase [Candidatus Diapherotrites archaeon]|nr:arsenite methyltransferase [Candidatus Diapherotrites archaeon]
MKKARKNAGQIKKIVREGYGRIASAGTGCSCGCSNTSNEELAKTIGYSDKEIKTVPEANLGLGCGNPTALGEIAEGATVLDLGSGAGFDCFLAAKKAGKTGKVIGVDMTRQMIKNAKENAKKYGYKNVEFRLGDIEKLPVEDNSVDVVISNCVINLAPDKSKVFAEAHRVLKKNGKMLVSDIVLLKELSEWQREDKKLVVGCVGGAVLKKEYLKLVENAGFKVKILSEDKKISKSQYQGIPLESLKIAAYKK